MSQPEDGSSSSGGGSFTCIECGAPVASLYTKYSADVIQLAKCGQCGRPADKYIECDRLVLGLDVLLHRLSAARHLLHNHAVAPAAVWRGLLLLVICEAYVLWLEARDLDSDLSAAVFTAAKELEFYAKLMVSALQTGSMILALLSNEFVNCGTVQLHKTAKLVLVTGCCRALLLPLLAWRSAVGFDLFFWLAFLLTFSLTLTGLMALRRGQGLHLCLLESVLACNCSRFTVAMLADAVLARYGAQFGLVPPLVPAFRAAAAGGGYYGMVGGGGPLATPAPPPFIPNGYQFFMAA